MLTYFDPIDGRRRVKRRYSWALCGFLLGVLSGVTLLALFH